MEVAVGLSSPFHVVVCVTFYLHSRIIVFLYIFINNVFVIHLIDLKGYADSRFVFLFPCFPSYFADRKTICLQARKRSNEMETHRVTIGCHFDHARNIPHKTDSLWYVVLFLISSSTSFKKKISEDLMSFDELSSASEKLSHLTTSRPKVTGRRLPGQFAGGQSVRNSDVTIQTLWSNSSNGKWSSDFLHRLW